MEPRSLRRRRGIVGAAVALFAAACLGSTEPPEVVTWEASLAGAEGIADPLAGSVAMVIAQTQTQIGIRVADGPPQTELAWEVRDGTCAKPGTRVGTGITYGLIPVSDTGSGEAETVVYHRIDTAGPYAAFVYEGTSTAGTVIACGDFERQN